MNNTPELIDYITFFECEPEWVHEKGWFYGARFLTRRGNETVVATIAPDEAEFSLEWRQNDRTLINLKLVMVTSWHLQNRKGKEQLVLTAASDREVLCILTLKPEVQVKTLAQW